MQAAGASWLVVIPEAEASRRLKRWAGEHDVMETPAQGLRPWVGSDGAFRGFGVDPRQMAALGLTPTPKLVAFWIERGHERALVKGLDFTVPRGVEQRLPSRSPHATLSDLRRGRSDRAIAVPQHA